MYTLAVESFLRENWHRDKFTCAAAQNEGHVLFDCQALCVLSQKKSLPFLYFYQSFLEKGPYHFAC